MIAVSVATAEPAAAPRGPERPHTVFRVEVLCNGRRHTVAKRYSEFQALHKRVGTRGDTGRGGGEPCSTGPHAPLPPQIRKSCKVPDFPPRRVPNWVPKVLEQRRQGLELYLQGVLTHNAELPPELLDFLQLRPQEPKGGSPA
ncbi:SNX22 protein, partial [Nothoprocta pentlandii]|nr:SNX22 protein [Nothoprocta pentlandii]